MRLCKQGRYFLVPEPGNPAPDAGHEEEQLRMFLGKRDEVILKCTECGNENYITTRNKRNHPNKMEINKFCPHCRKMTLHKEKK